MLGSFFTHHLSAARISDQHVCYKERPGPWAGGRTEKGKEPSKVKVPAASMEIFPPTLAQVCMGEDGARLERSQQRWSVLLKIFSCFDLCELCVCVNRLMSGTSSD